MMQMTFPSFYRSWDGGVLMFQTVDHFGWNCCFEDSGLRFRGWDVECRAYGSCMEKMARQLAYPKAPKNPDSQPQILQNP